MNEGADKCVLCQFHSQECTFVQSPQPRKRRLAGEHANGTGQKRSRNTSPSSPRRNNSSKPIREVPPITDYSAHPNNALFNTLGLQGDRHSHLVGPTAEYEQCLIDLCPFDSKDEYSLSTFSKTTSFRRVSDETTFTNYPDEPTPSNPEFYKDCDEIERIVSPNGQRLLNLYFRIVHPSFPILHKRVFLEKYARTHREFSAPLLAAVYILALHWWNYDPELTSVPKPDVAALEILAMKTMNEVIHRPKLSTVQAGLLLLQRNEMQGSAWTFTAQLVAIGQELGLHLDCTTWKIPRWEKGLRRRLAWGLFMQDKWGALTHGRPTHITKSNWAVRPVELEDFPDSVAAYEMVKTERTEEDEDIFQEVEKGRLLFEQMIQLSQLMADVLGAFFTVEAQMAFTGKGGTQKVLDRAKPIQIRLKGWFVQLPDCLRMDATTKNRRLSSTGFLHLAYFATEITLHRQILRTLSTPTSVDPYLLHICRSAAKTRLISAMDFVNRLKPEHLQSFWYFSSKVNFALIGTFGALLWATSPTIQEAEFYKARLSEYRWTLRVSSRGAHFMEFAVGVLDASAGYLQQEQLKKRGPLVVNGNYQSTVGNGENLGLGMGVGSGNIDLSQPPPLPPPGWRSTPEVTQRSRGHLSPVTNPSLDGKDEEDDNGLGLGLDGPDDMEDLDIEDVGDHSGGDDDDDEEDYDEIMDEDAYSDEADKMLSAQARYAGIAASVNARRGTNVSAGFAAYQNQQQQQQQQQQQTNSSASTPASTTASSGSNAGMDFFMIPNTGFGSGGE
ncbi:Similar to Transcriptional activator protein DAL81; acc. no. P21657 [Pyronema omphalodes CBS 100304]|uniref:Similar to Transcriptional activator protein DAL81 acc. no. P21657 n=1 Tax=Pyronema omphalodes (strain CBS 100304) TaxID=1076935 RepID=U4LSR7_PYROM|nr:Similar to Transcriptional activator protein DAL81; acc. no. P21657 [Pyronema omphalodes CBS 100304]